MLRCSGGREESDLFRQSWRAFQKYPARLIGRTENEAVPLVYRSKTCTSLTRAVMGNEVRTLGSGLPIPKFEVHDRFHTMEA
jgi:hypothetical protein